MVKVPSANCRPSEQGGLTILLALILVSVMGAATFSMSRNVIRELSMGGTVVQGEKASAAADAGLDWVVVWGQGYLNSLSYAGASPTGGQSTLVTSLTSAMSGVNTGLPITIAAGTDSTMTLNNGGSANSTQQFDLELRYLGPGWGNSSTGGASSDNNAASGYKKGGAGASNAVGWRVLATGKATPTAPLAQTYQAQRELIATFPN